MNDEDWLWQSWKQVLFSYLHKLVLVAAAWAGFAALDWLGDQKTKYTEKLNTQWQVSPAMGHTLLAPCPRDDRGEIPGFATQKEAIEAVQERAEACEWKRFTIRVMPFKQAITQLRSRGKLAEEDLKLLTRYYDQVAKEEAYARARAAGARKRVAAWLLNGGLKKERLEPTEETGLARKIYSTLNEDSASHVIYQLLWYGSLIFGLAASTLLGVLILTALPITDGEGYWTQRLGQIFERIPGTANRTIAMPLLAATLGAGTLAGTVAETQPGGKAWTIVDQREVRLVSGSEFSTDYTWLTTNYEGDEYVFPAWPTATPPWEEVTRPLEEIKEAVKKIEQKTVEANKIIGMIGNITTNVEAADLRLDDLESSVQGLRSTSGHILNDLHDLQPVIERVEETDKNAFFHTKANVAFVDDAEEREEEALAQSGEVDTRSAFKRNFLWTVYKVGPAVPRIMGERLEGAPEQKAFVKALEAMQNEPARSSRNFKNLLRKHLDVQKLSEEQIEHLVDNHFLSLRKICTLPRR
ncbi:MAG TPA: hypothetical protein VFR31_02855 [Thermoanaerobaculia bacterium]|nr:hypothetical protein [Thermoanaerobaculia bacterium]